MSLELEEEKPRRYLDEEWKAHPFTKDLVDSVSAELEQYYGMLVNAASKSADPAVRQAYERYRTTAEFLQTLKLGLMAIETQKEEESNDDTD